MKKCLSLLIGIVSFFGISTVKADTFQSNSFYNEFEDNISAYNTYKENIDILIDYYNNHWKDKYPYYFINFNPNCAIDAQTSKHVSCLGLYPLIDNSIKIENFAGDYLFSTNIPINTNIGDNIKYRALYVPELNLYNYDNTYINLAYPAAHNILLSNTKLIFRSTEKFDNVLIPSFSSDTLNVSYDELEIKDGNVFPTFLDLYNNTYNPISNDYIEINLNNYAYVALSLKDYSKEIKNSYSEYSNLYVKGQLCATPVYNYGQTEKKDIVSGSKNQACSQYYDNFTLSRFYILPNDIKNHAIYYLKAYDTTKENIVKVDPNYFHISYITEDDKDNPKVTINGKEYPTLAYDSLSDTATKSEDEGYVSGLSCAVGDMNCYIENNPSNLFDNLFDKPLEKLKQIWSAITQIFTLIGSFIMLLPAELQAFLYISLGIALVLGIIKIIL